MANERQLPSKEQALFRQIVKYYETKNYKKGLKAAEQILKKFPEHGGEPRTRSPGWRAFAMAPLSPLCLAPF